MGRKRRVVVSRSWHLQRGIAAEAVGVERPIRDTRQVRRSCPVLEERGRGRRSTSSSNLLTHPQLKSHVSLTILMMSVVLLTRYRQAYVLVVRRCSVELGLSHGDDVSRSSLIKAERCGEEQDEARWCVVMDVLHARDAEARRSRSEPKSTSASVCTRWMMMVIYIWMSFVAVAGTDGW